MIKKHVCAALTMLLLLATAGAAGQAKSKDYLDTVRAIQKKIRARLEQPVKTLDIDLIMEGEDFFGAMPYNIRWDSDDSRFWFDWKRWNEEETGTFEYVLAGGSLKRLSKENTERVPPADAVWDEAHTKAMWTVRNTVWFYDGKKKATLPLVSGIGAVPPPPEYSVIGSPGRLYYEAVYPFPFFGSGAVEPVTFTRDGRAVLFYDNNLFTIALPGTGEKGGLEKLTDIRTGTAPPKEPPTAGQRWLKKEQLKLFEVLQRRHNRRSRETSRVEQAQPEPFYLAGWQVVALLPSPDLKYCALMLFKDSPHMRSVQAPNFITVSSYPEMMSTGPRPGDELTEYKLGIMDMTTGRTGWVDFDEYIDPARRTPLVSYVHWSPDSRHALTSFGTYHDKNGWLGLLNPGNIGDGKLPIKILSHEHDDAWVNTLVLLSYGWFPDSENAWLLSERSGWMHLYAVSIDTGKIRPLTKGDYHVLRPYLATGGQSLLFYASKPGVFELQTYLLPLSGGKMKQLTAGMGRADGVLSPGGTYLAAAASGSNRPWEIYIKRVDEPGMGKQVTSSSSPAFKSYSWIEPEIIFFPAEDGTKIPARLFLPQKTHPKKPAVIFAHGAGWLHNVHHWWSSYAHEYCFHHLLMEHGYTVLDIDFRGSAGYGRDWRTAIYRDFVAGKIEDVRDGSKYLTRKYGIEPERIGIYGGSGGGMMTLMALFKTPEYFGAGAALRSLPDVAHYHPGIPIWVLNLPQEDPQAYYNSSPLYHVEGLEDPLLLCHGTSEVNTHFHGILRLVQRLIELRKTGWELAVYPMESHSFTESSSWADEYRRIFKLFEEHLKK